MSVNFDVSGQQEMEFFSKQEEEALLWIMNLYSGQKQ